jgi:putative ABC transport system permease protein
MSILESFRVAWVALLSNKVRALLTMLGIIIGVGAVVGMLAIGNGLSNYIEGEFNKMGVGVFYIMPQVDSTATDVDIAPRLTAEDAEAILRPGVAPAVTGVVVEYQNTAVAGGGGDRYYYPVKGITPSHFTVAAHELAAGRFYTPEDEQERARVAVIGYEVAATLYGSIGNALGQRMTLDGVSFDVVGVIATEPSMVSNDFDSPGETVYVPYQTARSRLFRNQVSTRVDVDQITVQARSVDEVDPAIEQVTALLRERHRLTYQPNDFRIDNPEEDAANAQATIIGLKVFLGIIAGISLLVGGIGIMNIMLVSVTQRTREIGLRKAVGARPRDILQQFLIEAILLCFLGGAFGVLLGYGMSFAGTFVLEEVFRAEGSRATVSANAIILATTISTAIGVGFGFFPALRAARLNPIQALRSE